MLLETEEPIAVSSERMDRDGSLRRLKQPLRVRHAALDELDGALLGYEEPILEKAGEHPQERRSSPRPCSRSWSSARSRGWRVIRPEEAHVGTQVRLPEHHRISERRGMVGKVVNRYAGHKYTAVDVCLPDCGCCFWDQDLEETAPQQPTWCPIGECKSRRRQLFTEPPGAGKGGLGEE